ncbi:zinc finger MYM-type protein 1-like [Aphis craccivora]|uniref:Zinc finger MYM-type protein 1-like n=1 Tax=Aphis craccivora TaxID=307492 RepID=A0A6G0WA39_APHCR|nr:zinc finger MYM-type protein 1-like [Aphis craccivora]
MLTIFNIKKPSSSVPNVSTAVDDLSQSKGLEKDINDPGLDVSSDVNDLDLGDLASGPRRPILKNFPKKKIGSQNRSFSAGFYKDFEWLEYSINKDSTFCYVCRMFSSESGNAEDTFTKIGLKSHASATNHLVCLSRLNEYKCSKKNGSVLSQLSSQHQQQITKNRNYLTHLIDIALYLAKQGISFRGHDEKYDSNNQGNFKEICKLFSKYDNEFEEMYLKKINLTSWAIQEDLIKLCADQVKGIILNELADVGFFSIMCDEARCFREEQLSICVRYVVGLEVHERFMGFVNVSGGQDASSIVAAINNFFTLQQIDTKTLSIIAQSYDGASVMSGKLNGVQAKIKEIHPCAIYTHCMAHRLNLVVVDFCKNIKSARNVFNVLEAVYVHFSHPSNNLKLSEIQANLGLKKGNILKVCDTRWVCRYKNCEAMLKNYTAIVTFLNSEIDDQADKDVTRAIGILSSIQKCDFIIVITILKEVLCIINVLSNSLQNKSSTLGFSKNVIFGVIKTFESLRSEGEFKKIWEKIKILAEENGICIQTPLTGSKRRRRELNKLHDYVLTTTTSAENASYSSLENEVENYWKISAYFVIMDSVVSNLKYRFSDESLAMANSVDSFCKLDTTNSMKFIDHYKDLLHISKSSLQAEMKVVLNLLKSKKKDFNLNDVKEVIEKQTYPNLYKLFQVALSIPISSATCERSFSSMRRIKNWLRSSMAQDRFTFLSILNIERDITNKVNVDDIVNKFAEKDRKIMLI